MVHSVAKPMLHTLREPLLQKRTSQLLKIHSFPYNPVLHTVIEFKMDLEMQEAGAALIKTKVIKIIN